jgi:hypothetical protein
VRPQGGNYGRRVCRRLSTVQIALNIADVSAPAAGQQPVRRMAARRTPASLVAVASQPEMDTQVVIWRARGREFCVQPYWITCGWLISRRQATYAQPEGQTRVVSCLQADAQLNTRCSIAHGSCNYECKEWQALRDGFAIGSKALSAHMHSCMHCGAQSDTMVAAVHRMLQCAAMASNVAQFKDKDRVWTGMRPPGAVHVTGEDKPSREKVLCWNAVATLFRPLAEAWILRMRTTALVLKILRA